jgi:hypothetical protein
MRRQLDLTWERPGHRVAERRFEVGPRRSLAEGEPGRITHQNDQGEYMAAHDLGKGEGGPDDLILAAALLLIKTDR